MIEVHSAKLVLELLDTETGEIMTKETSFGDFKEKKPRSSSSKKVKDDGSEIPHLTVIEGKWQLNNAAIALTGFEPDMKIDIRYEKQGKLTTPILLADDKGNRLTKTFTVSCKGQKREQLLKYGTLFEIQEYKDGMFKLIGDGKQEEDDIIEIPEEISDPELDDSILDNISFDLE